MLQKGDTVRFLNAVGGGVVTRVDGNIAYVCDEDGFETPTLVRECVVVEGSGMVPPAGSKKNSDTKVSASATAPKPQAPKTEPKENKTAQEPSGETVTGDVMNLVLAFEPANVKQLSDTTYYCSIVNDSNYFVNYLLLARDNADASASNADANWTLVSQGMIEPNIELLVDEFDNARVARFDRLAVQFTACKHDAPFTLQKPVDVRISVDTTKFFKLHCFKNNPYFENPVLAFDIVRNGVPYGPTKVDARELEQSLKAKIREDRKPRQRPVMKRESDPNAPLEVDLHIHELLDNTRGLSSADILNIQVDKFREVMDANLRNHGKKIVFIHGKGEGVLRQALTKELNHMYKGHDVQDASFAQYGYGATQVTIK